MSVLISSATAAPLFALSRWKNRDARYYRVYEQGVVQKLRKLMFAGFLMLSVSVANNSEQVQPHPEPI